MYWNSIWATSGAPVPACSAVRSLVYCGVPAPAFTTFTLMAGYFCSNRAISLSMFGTHVQNVSWVGVVIALSMSAWLTAVGDGDPEAPPGTGLRPPVAAEPERLPPQGASPALTVSALVAASRPLRDKTCRRVAGFMEAP